MKLVRALVAAAVFALGSCDRLPQAGRAAVENLQLGELDIRQKHRVVADLSQIEAVLGGGER